MTEAAQFIFWLSLVALCYACAGFPLLVFAIGLLRGREVRPGPATPTVSLLIAANNEVDGIAARLDNALALDYPRAALEIIVASDGSTDGTDDIVREYAARGVRLLVLPRAGKIAALHAAVRQAAGAILVFSDANTQCEPQAVSALVRNFADPDVGGVVGHTGYRVGSRGDSSGLGERLYWRYDTWLKRLESRAGNVVSAHGGLYAIRRELYSQPLDPAVTDDFAISTGVVKAGRRLVFESEARAWERPALRANEEFGRRVRLMTRGLRGVLLRRELLNPFRHGTYAVFLFSHKIVRRLTPLTLPGLLVGSVVLASASTFYGVAFVAQAVFYLLAAVGYAGRGTRIARTPLLYFPFFYCMASLAGVVALWRFVRGDRIALWRPQRQVGGAV